MGGSGKTQQQTQSTQTPVNSGYYGVSPVMQTVQPFAPGQLELIAAQLAGGYGGASDTYQDHMNAIYKPVEIPDYPAAHRAQPIAPSAPASKPASAGSNSYVPFDFLPNGMPLGPY